MILSLSKELAMNRRSVLKRLIAAAGGAALPHRLIQAQQKADAATRGMPAPKIKDVSVIATAPAGLRLTVVKVVTDQDGLYGYGCGTFTQPAELVNAAVEKYVRPFVIGKPADRIDDLWQAMYNSSYWRNGPVLNNAISGIDQALWDIKGRQAGMPVYELAGGKHREAADCYAHADRREIPELIDKAKQLMAQGSGTCACKWASRGWRHMARRPARRSSRDCTMVGFSSRPTMSAPR
jgi:mannonate dehydratase